MTLRRYYRTLVTASLLAVSVTGNTQESAPLFPVLQDQKWGYMDRDGKVVIPFQFEYEQPFREGRAQVTVRTGGKAKTGVLDRKTLGVTAINADFILFLHNYSEGLVPYYSGKSGCGYKDAEGKTAIAPQWESCDEFSEGLALVKSKASTHADYIDHNGRKAVSSPAPEGFSFHNGLARVGQWWPDGAWRGYIDRTGKLAWSSGALPVKKTRLQ